MNTIKRLQRLTGEDSSEQKKSSRADEIIELRRRIEAITSRRPASSSKPVYTRQEDAVSLKDMMIGEEIRNAWGKFFISDGYFSGSSKHGSRRIGEISSLDMNAVALLANNPDMAFLNCTDALFLDTETTGLTGGTGTFAFLIGLGWFENDTFCTKQIFARDFSEERASLSFLLDLAGEKSFIVSYNGKAFDVGLLSTRFILNRLPDRLANMPHLDLLHPARRLLGHRLENNRLITMEKEILGIHRQGDIPGCEIPQRYFDWLRNRDARLLTDVFEHNRLDIISMATLSLHLTEMLNYNRDISTCEHKDLLASAKLLLARRDASGARKILEFVIESECLHVALEARKTLSLIYKRSGHLSDAVRIWEMMLLDDPGNFFATEEMAKCFEHRKHDLPKAIDIVIKALNNSCVKTISERNILSLRLKRLKSRMVSTYGE
jgi:uncharacterized protein YprB with RNaseH-like and TPR domain